MKKKVVILAFVFILLLFLYLFGSLGGDKDSPDLTKEKALLVFDKDSVVRLRLLGSIGNSIDISRSSSLPVESPLLHRANWVLKDPVFAPVDENIFDDLISRVSKISGTEFTEEADEESLGLTPPELILILDFKGGAEQVISFGAKSSVTKRRFLQKEGDVRFYVSSKDFPKYVTEIQDKIKSREVLKINPELVTGVDVIHEDRYFRVLSNKCQVKEDKWIVAGGAETQQGDSQFISRKIRELSNLKVKRIFETPLDVFSFTGLDNPFLILNISFQVDESGNFACDSGRKKELLLQFGKGLGVQLSGKGTLATDVSYYLKVGGEVRLYEIEKVFFSDWLQGAFHFRERCPFCDISEVLDSVTSLSVSDPNDSCTVVFGKEAVVENSQLMDSLKKSLQEIRFDALLDEDELRNYTLGAGVGFEMSLSEKEGISLEVVGSVQPDVSEGGDNLSPLILKVKRKNEAPYHGVLSEDTFLPLRTVLKSFCTDGAS